MVYKDTNRGMKKFEEYIFEDEGDLNEHYLEYLSLRVENFDDSNYNIAHPDGFTELSELAQYELSPL